MVSDISGLSVGAVSVEVAEQGDLGAVVDHLAVDVGDQRRQRLVGVRTLGRSARPGQALLAEARGRPRPSGRSRRRAGRAHRRRSRGTSTSRSRPAGRRSGTRCGRRGRRRRGGRAASEIVVTGAGTGSGYAKSIVVAVAVDVDVPGPGHRLPQVLVVGEAVEPGSQLADPVVLELVEQQLVPGAGSCVVVMSTTLSPPSGQDRSAIGGILGPWVTRPNESSGCWRCCSSGRCGPGPSWPTGWG